MASSISDIFRIADLRKKIIFTLVILICYRIGTFIPIPGINIIALQNELATSSGSGFSLSDYFDFFSGGAFNNYSIFMLGIMPYISMSIIMQLLMIAVPALKRMAEQDGGRNLVKRYTRYGTLVLAVLQAAFLPQLKGDTAGLVYPSLGPVAFMLISIITVTTGTMIIMWLGEQITAHGIGNGASLIIFTGIVVRLPEAVGILQRQMPDQINPIFGLLALGVFVVMVVLIIYEQQAQRRVPVRYANRVVGQRMYQGQSTYIPFKLNPSGVIPVIFGQAVLQFLAFVLGTLAQRATWLQGAAIAMAPGGLVNTIIYVLLIVFFAYFYTQVTMSPIEMARQIRENNGSIPGVRMENLESYLGRVLNRVVLPGAVFLAFIAVVPTIMLVFFRFPLQVAYLMGGTSLLIMVGVNLDTMSQVEGHLKMHNHEGLLKKGRIRSRNL
ncbi:preprotein translocase subunit SecY [Candidatus Haliotispira prima]|uniref:Protein translocase subunit SecY n=1 Tax=Candidatus Haliotispira prima TaxID=3034016 RepID=A0ABY8MG78_9SPIO|nr:preprotein translocase subunit SecY [Candidatus Haliotispira prima]